MLSGCDSFLEEAPTKKTGVLITKFEQLDALLEKYTAYYQDDNAAIRYGSDDHEIPVDMYLAKKSAFEQNNLAYMTWNHDLVENETYTLWTEEYAKIFNANTVIEYIGKVSGGSEAEKQQLKAEAHLIRAYSMIELANMYCLPYTEQNKDESGDKLGLVLKRSTSFEENDRRATLEQTHRMIEEDLEEALKLTTPITVNGTHRSWRGSKAAANAVAARYWLQRNDYEKAKTYAVAALAEHDYVADFNDPKVMRFADRAVQVNVTGVGSVDIWYPFLNADQGGLNETLEWKELYFMRYIYCDYWLNVPSASLINTYVGNDPEDQRDLRFKYFMVEGGLYDSPSSLTNPAYYGYTFSWSYKDLFIGGPTTAEMLLIKAECEARSGDYTTAQKTVNQLRAKRVDNTAGSFINLTFSGQDDAIRQIIEERRREMPFTARWADCRRLNNNGYAADDVTITKTFYEISATRVETSLPPKEYRLAKGDNKWAYPIPKADIESSNGRIEQNPQ